MPKDLLLFLLIITVFHCAAQPPIAYLKNKKEIAFYGKPGEVQSITIKKNLEILILDEKGIEMFENFTFPEPLDPLYQDIAAPIKNHHNHFFVHKINHFELRVKRDNSYIASYDKLENVTREKYLDELTQSYNASYLYHLNIENLKVGDLIKLNYEITIPYLENEIFLRSMRFFVDEKYPSEETELRILYNTNLNLSIGFQNNGEPTKTYGKDEITLKWNAEKLPGALSEKNGRAYKTLPYVEIFINYARTYWPAYFRFSVHHMLEDQMSIKLGSTSKQYQLLNDFNKSNIVNSESDFDRMKRVANTIASDFKYDNDSIFFNGDRLLTMPKFGNDINDKRLRESNKIQLYNSLIYSSNLAYGALFVSDVRTAELSKFWMQPIYLSDFFFLPMSDERSMVLYPKSQQCGFFADEIPYYFENAKAEFVPVQPTIFKKWQSQRKKEFDFMTIPTSEIDSNVRNTVVKATYNNENQSFEVDFEITLKGQFSTIYRPLYQCNETLLHSDNIYHNKLWDKMDVQNLNFESKVITTDFPYTTKITGSFDVKSINELNIHPVYSVSSTDRTLPFYADFVGKDNFILTIENAGIQDSLEDIVVRNDFGRYIFKLQSSEESTTIYSNLIIFAPLIEAEKIEQVSELYLRAGEFKGIEISK